MEINVQELEMAVLYAHKLGLEQNPEAVAIKDQATRFCDEVRLSSSGWKAALQLLKTTAHNEPKFFALTTLQEALGARAGCPCQLGVEECQQVRQALGPWLSVEQLKEQPAFVRTKMAVLVGLLVKQDYPLRWPTAFQEILGLAQQGSVMIEFFLRCLDAVDEDIVSFHVDRTQEEVDRNMAVKDHVRATSDIGDAVSFLCQTVQAWLSRSPGPGNQHISSELATSCLTTLGKYVGWIDINLIANEQVLTVLFQCATNSIDTQVSEASLGCVYELVSKGMDKLAKLQLLQSLQLQDLLAKVQMADVDVAQRVGQLVDAVGQELLECWDDLEPDCGTGDLLRGQYALSTASMSKEILQLALACLAHPDAEVSGSMLPYIQRLLTTLKRQILQGYRPTCEEAFSIIQHVPTLYRTIANRLPLDFDHKFDANDEDDGEEEEHRKQLLKVFINITRITPELGLACVCETVSRLPPSLANSPWPQLEAALRLVFHFSEGCVGGAPSGSSKKQPSNNPTALLKEGTFPALLVAIHESDIRDHKHTQILLLYYNIAIRYCKVLTESRQNLIAPILEAITGKSGLSHPSNLAFRARCCYLLLKLVKAMGGAMGPFVGTVARGIEDLLSCPSLQTGLDHTDLFHLYQALGYLLGLSTMKVQEQKEYLEIILLRQITFIRELMQPSFLQGADSGVVGDQLSHHIAAIAHISQGIKQARSELIPLFVEALEVATSVLNAMPSNANVRQKTTFLLHRMITCLDKSLIGFLPVPLLSLVVHCDSDDLPQVIALINDLMINFKQELFLVVDSLFLTLVNKLFFTVNQKQSEGVLAAPHELVEQEALTKLFFSVVFHIVTHNLMGILFSPTNVPHLESILQVVLQGLEQKHEPVVKKNAISIFALLMKGLSTEPQQQGKDCDDVAGVRQTIIDFIGSVAFCACVKYVMIDQSFNLDDASAVGVLNKFAEFLLVLKAVHGTHFSSHISNQMTMSFQCPPTFVAEFCDSVFKCTDVNKASAAVKAYAMLARST